MLVGEAGPLRRSAPARMCLLPILGGCQCRDAPVYASEAAPRSAIASRLLPHMPGACSETPLQHGLLFASCILALKQARRVTLHELSQCVAMRNTIMRHQPVVPIGHLALPSPIRGCTWLCRPDPRHTAHRGAGCSHCQLIRLGLACWLQLCQLTWQHMVRLLPQLPADPAKPCPMAIPKGLSSGDRKPRQCQVPAITGDVPGNRRTRFPLARSAARPFYLQRHVVASGDGSGLISWARKQPMGQQCGNVP